MAEQAQAKVVRIVNLDETFTEPTLKDFIQEKVKLEGKIENLYIRIHENRLLKFPENVKHIVYAYIIFEKSCDALETSKCLNGYTHDTNTFDAALVAPHLELKKYDEPTEMRNIRTNAHIRPNFNTKDRDYREVHRRRESSESSEN